MSEKISMKDVIAAAKAASLPGVDPSPGDASYDVPFETVRLPSGGKCYGPEHPLYGCDSVDIRPMRHSDENILSSRALLKKGTALTTLIKAVMHPRNVDPDSMLVGDKNAVLIAIRNISYGPEYETEVRCPNCDTKVKAKFDMSKLPVTPLSRDPDQGPGHNAFTCVLPISKKRVVFKILNAHDANDLNSAIEASAKNRPGQPDETATLTTLFQVVSVDGNEDRHHIARFVNNMIAGDALELRRSIREVSPGIDTTRPFTCPVPACSETTEVEVGLGPEFFWPSSRR